MNVAANAPASVANTANISGGGDVDTANNTATDVATILPKAPQVEPPTDVEPGDDSGTDTNEQETAILISDGGDFDGDGKTDLAVFRPSTGEWLIVNSSTGGRTVFQWGSMGDVPVAGDYDGDGKTDLAVFRPVDRRSGTSCNSSTSGSTARSQWGSRGRHARSRATTTATARPTSRSSGPSTGTWYILQLEHGESAAWRSRGAATATSPVPGDYDGDGKADLAVFRPVDRHVVHPSTRAPASRHSSYSGAAAATCRCPATTTATARPTSRSSGPRPATWYIVQLEHGRRDVRSTWGSSGDIPVPGDYDGDGKTDLAVFRPSTGEWYIVNSSTAIGAVFRWGTLGDIPL